MDIAKHSLSDGCLEGVFLLPCFSDDEEIAELSSRESDSSYTCENLELERSSNIKELLSCLTVPFFSRFLKKGLVLFLRSGACAVSSSSLILDSCSKDIDALRLMLF